MTFPRLLCAISAALALAVPATALDLTETQVDAMRAADVVILGEVHDNPHHHKGQAELIARLAPAAVVFEMLSTVQAEAVNTDTRGDLPALAERIDWAGSGWPDFTLYAPVFAALEQTPVAGAALPRDTVRAAFDQGAAAVFAGDAARFGLEQDLPRDALEARKALQFEAHCAAMPLDMMGGMVEAQRLRDAHFAGVTLAALNRYGAPVVVIAGNGHARRDWGMPAMIAYAAPDVSVFSLGFVETPADPDDPRFDVSIPTDPATRPDPCAAFKK